MIIPNRIWFGASKWHDGEQWFLHAHDVEKDEVRDFALVDIHKMEQPGDDNGQADPASTNESLSSLKEAKLYTDGGSRGNPGPSALGFVICDMEENVVKKESKYLGITTNNQAEYQGVKDGLEACHDLGIREVHVYMDSMLVVNQMKGIFKVKNRDLWPIHQSTKDLLPNFSHVTFTHIPRELNRQADSMVNECLDAHHDKAGGIID